MPGWLQPVAEANPFTVAVDAARGLSLGTGAADDVVKTLIWAIALTAVAMPLAVRRYRRV
jgi:oleandomycin transport system permease protein